MKKILIVILLAFLFLIGCVLYLLWPNIIPHTYKLGEYDLKMSFPRGYLKVDSNELLEVYNTSTDVQFMIMDFNKEYFTGNAPIERLDSYVKLASAVNMDKNITADEYVEFNVKNYGGAMTELIYEDYNNVITHQKILIICLDNNDIVISSCVDDINYDANKDIINSIFKNVSVR